MATNFVMDAKTKSTRSVSLRERNARLVTDFLSLDMRLEFGARKVGSHVIQQRVNVRSGVSHRNSHVNCDDRIPSRGESASQRECPGELRFGAAQAGETDRRLCGLTGQFQVVLH